MEGIDLESKIGKPVFNELEHIEKLHKSKKTGQYKVELTKQTAAELTT